MSLLSALQKCSSVSDDSLKIILEYINPCCLESGGRYNTEHTHCYMCEKEVCSRCSYKCYCCNDLLCLKCSKSFIKWNRKKIRFQITTESNCRAYQNHICFYCNYNINQHYHKD